MGNKSKSKVDELQEYANENGIELWLQVQICQLFFKTDQTFHELDEYDAGAILTGFKEKGQDYWTNRAKAEYERITGATGDLPEETEPANGEEPEASTPATVEKSPRPPGKVYHADRDEFVQVTADQRSLASSLQECIDVAALVTSVVLKRMADEELYLAVDDGYSSFKDYVERRCKLNYRQAKKYLAIGRRFAPMLPAHFEGEGQSTALDSSASGAILKNLGQLGVEKLYQMSQLEDADFSQLESDGTFVLSDGTEVDIEEVKTQTTAEFTKQLDEHRQYIRDLEAELNQSENAKAKAERKASEIETSSETGLKYRDMFGQKSDEYQAFKSRLADARGKALDLNQVLSKIEDLPIEYGSLREELRSLHKIIDNGLTELRNQNIDVFTANEDEVEA